MARKYEWDKLGLLGDDGQTEASNPFGGGYDRQNAFNSDVLDTETISKGELGLKDSLDKYNNNSSSTGSFADYVNSKDLMHKPMTGDTLLSNPNLQTKIKEGTLNTFGGVANAFRTGVQAADQVFGDGKDGAFIQGLNKVHDYVNNKTESYENQFNQNVKQGSPEYWVGQATEALPQIAITAPVGGALGLGAKALGWGSKATKAAQMLPFGVSATGNYEDQAEKDGATPLQRFVYGTIGGTAEAASEAYFGFPKILQKAGVMQGAEKAAADLINKGADTLWGKYGAAGISYLKGILGEAGQEAIIDPIMGTAEKAIYNPDKAWTGENGVFDGSQMKQDAGVGAIMAVMLSALGMHSSTKSHKKVSNMIENNTPPTPEDIQELHNQILEDTQTLPTGQSQAENSNTVQANLEENQQINNDNSNFVVNSQPEEIVPEDKYQNWVDDTLEGKTDLDYNEYENSLPNNQEQELIYGSTNMPGESNKAYPKVNLGTMGEVEVLNDDGKTVTVRDSSGQETPMSKMTFDILNTATKINQPTQKASTPKTVSKTEEIQPKTEEVKAENINTPTEEKPSQNASKEDLNNKHSREKLIKKYEEIAQKYRDSHMDTDHPDLYQDVLRKLEGLKAGKPFTVTDATQELKDDIAYVGGQIPTINKNGKDELIGKPGITMDEAKDIASQPEFNNTEAAEDNHVTDTSQKVEDKPRFSEEQQKQLNELEEEHKKTISTLGKNWDEETKQKQLKAEGMKHAARKREIIQGESLEPVEGGLTAKELADKNKRMSGNYIGKKVNTPDGVGIVRANPFGKVAVEFTDESGKKRTKNYDKKDISEYKEGHKVNDQVEFTHNGLKDAGTITQVYDNGIVEIQRPEGDYVLAQKKGDSFESLKSQSTTKEDIPIDERETFNVGDRKIKAYQYLHPELKHFIQEDARVILQDLKDTQKHERYGIDKSGTQSGYNEPRITSNDIAYLRDMVGMSYADIEEGLNKLIEDNGSENNAKSKKVEIVIDNRLSHGYKDFKTGYDVEPNQDYIAKKNEIEGKGEKLNTEAKDEAPEKPKEFNVGDIINWKGETWKVYDNDASPQYVGQKEGNLIKLVTIERIANEIRTVNKDELKDATMVKKFKPKEEKPKETLKEHLGNKESQSIANEVVNLLNKKQKFTSRELYNIADKAYGGTQAESKYAVKDAFDAMELGINQFLEQQKEVDLTAEDRNTVKANIYWIQENVLDLIPRQYNRTDEMQSFQQFSTPPTIAYVTNWLANVEKGDTVLEPSAGIGGIAVFPKISGAKVIVNELSERRLDVLKNMGFDEYYNENGEQLNNILPDEVKPTVVEMNPPFSSSQRTVGKNDTKNAGKHIEQALLKLEEGGRLVAIVGQGMSEDAATFKDWWKEIKSKYNVRANVGLDGENYKKYGTTWGIQILVIDKTGPTTETKTGLYENLTDLVDILGGIQNARQSISSASENTKQSSNKPGSKKTTSESEGANNNSVPLQPTTDELGNREHTKSNEQGNKESDGARSNVTDKDKAGERNGASNETGTSKDNTGKSEENKNTADSSGLSTRDNGEQFEGSRDNSIEENPELEINVKSQEKQKEQKLKLNKKNESSDSVYSEYAPPKLDIEGAKPHLGKLSESAAMAAVEPPDPTYSPDLPKELITSGALSLPQLESTVYAGQAHSQVMANGYRKGFFIGDGTGVGKGRQVASIILDNFRQGRKKAVWVSKSQELIQDAQRDWGGLGQDGKQITNLNKNKLGNKIDKGEGIIFTTYDTMKTGLNVANGGSDKDVKPGNLNARVEQIIDWVGKDFDGVIVFDEAHMMSNVGDGKKKGTQNARAGLLLQKRLPNARVVYASATGATEVNNLGYASRLGLWGPGTAFASESDFVSKIDAGGLAAMELVSRDMKSMGVYLSRNLSYDGVDYENLTHKLSPEQKIMYDKTCEAWQIVLQNMNKVLGITNQNQNSQAKRNAKGAFWSSNQRFYNSLMTSMGMPTVLKDMEERLKNGESPVLQLVSTNEAELDRQLEKMRKDDGTFDDIDLSPKATLLNFLEKAFPTDQYVGTLDDNGNKIFVPETDSKGNIVQNREALEIKKQLMEDIGALRMPEGPIEMVINKFGAENVAEITGRKKRVVKGKNGELFEEKLGEKHKTADTEAFMDGRKKILIFSDAGGTGRSYHAANDAKNQRHRVHYLIQAGWEAKKAVQGFGRTHRTNEASAPTYILVSTDLKGQKRFLSTIARRLDQLGALTKGQREAGSSGMFKPSDNLENKVAKDALKRFFIAVDKGKIPGLGRTLFFETGLADKLFDKDNKLKVDSPEMRDVPHFLNRILCQKSDKQNLIFDSYANIINNMTEEYREKGLLDEGLEILTADKIKQLDSKELLKTPNGTTSYHQIEMSYKTVPLNFDDVLNFRVKNRIGFYKNKVSNKIYAVYESAVITKENGTVVDAVRLLTQKEGKTVKVAKDDFTRNKNYEKLTDEQAEPLWNEAIKTLPEYDTENIHLISGTLLPVWDKLPNGNMHVVRVLTDDGSMLLGRVIDETQIDETLRRLGAQLKKKEYKPGEVIKKVLDEKYTVNLDNGWKLQRKMVNGEYRIEVLGNNLYNYRQELKNYGVFTEMIQYNTRFFIPTGESGINTLEKIIKNRAAIESLIPGKGGNGEIALTRVEGPLNLEPFGDVQQEISSADTSINSSKLPGTFTNPNFIKELREQIIKNKDIKIVDIGGGRFDNTKLLFEKREIPNVSDSLKAKYKNAIVSTLGKTKVNFLVYDKFNRDKATNDSVIKSIESKKADIVTCNNVLNVIDEAAAREQVILNCAYSIKPDGKVFFLIYEGSKEDNGKVTTSGWQNNAKADEYLTEVKKYFKSVVKKGNMIIAENPIVSTKGKTSNKTKTVANDVVTKGGTKIKRSKYGVGKAIGGQIYLHKDYAADVIPEADYKKAQSLLKKNDPDFKYNTLVYEAKTGRIRFDEAPNFDTAREPIPGHMIWVNPSTNEVEKSSYSNSIWHHKWLWVKDNYKGFNVDESKDWSKHWTSILPEKAIGRENKWKDQLNKYGIENSYGNEMTITSTGERQTDTPQFKKWFGDSKVTNPDGTPMVVYHGTGSDVNFDTFKAFNTPGWGKGIYFTDNPKATDEFSGEATENARIYPVYLKIENPSDGTFPGEDVVMETPTYKKMWEKQKQKAIKEGYYEDDEDIYIDPYDWWEDDGEFVNSVIRDLGYDGIIAQDSNNIDGKEIVVFNPNQVKSAIGNNGDFNPDVYSMLAMDIVESAKKAVKGKSVKPSYLDELSATLSEESHDPRANAQKLAEYLMSNGDTKSPINDFVDNLYNAQKSGNKINNKIVYAIEAMVNPENYQEEIKTAFGLTGSKYKEDDGALKALDSYFGGIVNNNFYNENEVQKAKEEVENVPAAEPETPPAEEKTYTKPNNDLNGASEGTDKKDRQTIVNSFMNSEAIPQKLKDFLRANPEMWKYIEHHNASAMEKAREYVEINEKEAVKRINGLDGFRDDMDTAIAIELVKKYLEDGDFETAQGLTERIAKFGTGLGQAIQYFSVLKRMTPTWSLNHVQKQVNKVITEHQRDTLDKNSKKVAEAMNEVNKSEGVINGVITKLKKIFNFGNDERAFARASKPAEERLADKIDRHLKTSKDEDDPIFNMIKTLYDVARKTLPPKNKPAAKTPIEFIKEAMNNSEVYAETWEKAKDVVKDNYKNNTEALDLLDEYFNQFLDKPFSDKQLTSAVKQAIKDSGINLGKLVREHYSKVDNTGKSLAEKLTEYGLNTEAAEALENFIKGEFARQTNAKKEMILANMFKENPKSKGRVKDYIQKIIETSNLGAFSSEKYKDAVAKKFKIPRVTLEDMKKITELANKVQEQKPGTREQRKARSELIEYMDTIGPASFWRKVNVFQTIEMLMNTKTASKNFNSNLIFGYLVTHAKNHVAAGIDKVVAKKTGRREHIAPSYATKITGTMEGFKDSWLDFKEGVNTRDFDDKLELHGRKIFGKSNSKYKAVRAVDKILGKMEDTTGLLMDDRPFKNAEVADSLRRQEIKAKINGEEFNIDDAKEKAEYEGNYVTFNDKNKFSKFMIEIQKNINSWTGSKYFGAGTIFIKFAKTPANLTMRAIDYSVISAGRAVYHAAKVASKKEDFNQEKFVDDLAKGITGSVGIIGLGILLTKLGALILDRDKDKDKNQFDQQTGVGAFKINLSAIARAIANGTFKTGGLQEGDLLVSFDWMQPVSYGLIFGGQLAASKSEKEKQTFLGNIHDYVTAFGAATNGLMNLSMLQNISKFFSPYSTPTEALWDMALSIPQSFTSSALNQLRQLTDNQTRETYSNDDMEQALNKTKARIPGLSYSLPNKVDSLGRDQETYQSDSTWRNNNIVNVMLNPSITTRFKPTPAEQVVKSIYDTTGNKIQYPRVVDKTLDLGNAGKIKLTTAEYQKYQRLMGQGTVELLNQYTDVIGNNDKDYLNDVAKEIQNGITDLNKDVKEQIAEGRGIAKIKGPKNKITWEDENADNSEY